MDENKILLDQILKVQERINTALVDTILENISIGKYTGDLEITDRGVREILVILKHFYSDEYNERIRELSGKEADNE